MTEEAQAAAGLALAHVKSRFAARSRHTPPDAVLPDLTNVYVVEVLDDADVESLCRLYRQDPHVEYAQPNYQVQAFFAPNDPYYGSTNSWGQGYDDLWGLKKLQLASAWNTTQGQGMVVAVVDTGLDYNHSDIAANVWANTGEIAGNGQDDDENGYIDDTRGWDFANNNNNPMDGHGHGTHVAGTIAAVGNNAMDVIGVAPKAKVMPVKGLDDNGAGPISDLAQGIVYAAYNGADVINNSWGCGYCPSNPVAEDAVRTAHGLGVVVVFAAGNSLDDVSNRSPQNMMNPKPIVVSATTELDEPTAFTSGGFLVDVAAPGGGSPVPPPDFAPMQNVLSLRTQGTGPPGLIPGANGGPFTLSANPSPVAPGGTITVSWTLPQEQSRSADWIGLFAAGAPNNAYLAFRFPSQQPRGSVTFAAPTTPGNYEARYLQTDTMVVLARSNTIAVNADASGQPTLTFSADPLVVNHLEHSTLSWTSTNATDCSASGGWTGTKSLSGTAVVTPTKTTTYTLTCIGPGGTAALSATVIRGTAYLRLAGTSMASPHVAGAAALLLAHRPTLTNDDVRQVLRVSADDVETPGVDFFTGAGRLNAKKALEVTSVLRVRMTSPAAGTVYNLRDVSSVTMIGTAAGTGFQQYQLFMGVGKTPTTWTPIGAPVTTPVTNGTLGTWSIGTLAPGLYLLRLVATSVTGTQFEDYTQVFLYRETLTFRQITTNLADQGDPDLSESADRIVWLDSRHGNTEIYLYDLTTSTERRITTNVKPQWNPAISQHAIVWRDSRNRVGGDLNDDIYLYDLTTNTERPITTTP